MNRVGITAANYVPGKIEKKPSVSKLADLNAKPAVTKVKKVKAVEVAEELVITEVTDA
jgi:hypothetical protein